MGKPPRLLGKHHYVLMTHMCSSSRNDGKHLAVKLTRRQVGSSKHSQDIALVLARPTTPAPPRSRPATLQPLTANRQQPTGARQAHLRAHVRVRVA